MVSISKSVSESQFSTRRPAKQAWLTSLALGVAIALGLFQASRAATPAADGGATLFQNVRVFNGKSATLSSPSNVLVRGNLIERISTSPIAADPNVRGATPFNSGFTVVDVNVGYEINENLKLNFGVDNVFDEDFPINYSTSRYREDAGRFAYVSLRGSF